MMPVNRLLHVEDQITARTMDGRPETRRAEAAGRSPKRRPEGRGAAGGGGEDRPLVTMANNSSAPSVADGGGLPRAGPSADP